MSRAAARILTAIVLGGLVAGTVDIFVAAAINHLRVGVILRAIASGLLGRASFSEGQRSMVIGLALQELMSLVIAAIYILASIRLPLLRRRPLALGALYGVGILLVMNFVVVPLSAAWPKHRPIHLEAVLLNLAAMILFGVIVAVST
ncbi:MAG TPA: hypothetical protein VGG68_15140, partial [Caulobacteraceae bacterium]